MKSTSKSVQGKTKVAFVRFTPEQYRIIEERAGRRQLRVGAWMREILLQAAKRPEGQYLRIQEPNGATS
jgi:hypothetical protein